MHQKKIKTKLYSDRIQDITHFDQKFDYATYYKKQY